MKKVIELEGVSHRFYLIVFVRRNAKNLLQINFRLTVKVTGISTREMICLYYRGTHGNSTIRLKEIIDYTQCFMEMAKLFFRTKFEIIVDLGGKNIAFD